MKTKTCNLTAMFYDATGGQYPDTAINDHGKTISQHIIESQIEQELRQHNNIVHPTVFFNTGKGGSVSVDSFSKLPTVEDVTAAIVGSIEQLAIKIL